MATPTAPRITITNGNAVPLESILSFAQRMYGAHSHQAQEAYYRWAYLENPSCTEGLGHAVLATIETGEVVGMVNRFLMKWDVNGTLQIIPGIGDLVVDEAYRHGGLGLRMVMACTKGTEHAFVNGSNANSSPLFRGLKYQEVHGAFWGMRLNNRFRAVWRHGLFRLLDRSPKKLELPTTFESAGHSMTTAPTKDQLQQLADLLNSATATVKPLWTVENLHWRFFHQHGPRHVLIYAVKDGTMDAAMLLSVGIRKGLRTCRPLAYSTRTAEGFATLLRQAIAMTKLFGIDVIPAFTFDTDEAKAMMQVGFQKNTEPPATFFFHKRRNESSTFNEVYVQGAASDLGLEAIDRV